MATSRVSVVEVGKAVARANPEADTNGILALLAFVELDAELAAVAADTGGASLRALDAIHVASALRLGPEIESFLTYDARQAEAAGAAGLRVLAPGGTDFRSATSGPPDST
jgi:predicted nucleic acid-binding protein